MGKFIDITGNKYNRLTVIRRHFVNGKNITYWECMCDCGNKTIVSKPNLTTNNVKSCGCLMIENITGNKHRLTHNESRTRLYHIWQSMKQRCYDKNVKEYKYYGSLGIIICDDWLKYENFSKWSKENGYKKNLTIDRKNNYLGYSAENCRWITTKEQNRNKKTNVILTYKNESKCVSEWAEELSIPKTTIFNRMKKTDNVNIILNSDYKRRFKTR